MNARLRHALIAVLAVASIAAVRYGVAPASAAEPKITSDIALVMDENYENGDIASISIRNDGDVAYKYNPGQEACNFTFKDSTGRVFEIPPAVHCDLPGGAAELGPGETAVVVPQWSLDECTAPGFFCFAVRPLATGLYKISGSLDSVDGAKRAEFSKSISIEGPAFTTDIEVQVAIAISDPPGPEANPVYLELRNKGQIDYSIPAQAACYMYFTNPDGHFISIPPATHCNHDTADTISPGETIRVVDNWKQDECIEFGPTSCVTTKRLPSGDYVISGALWSADKQSYAEFTRTLKIFVPTVTSSPSPTAKDLPKAGGSTGDAGPPMGIAAALAFGVLFAVLGGFAVVCAAGSSARNSLP